MKKSSAQFVTKMMLAAGLLAAPLAQAATTTWSGASGTDLLWSTAGNWSPSGSPGINDTVQFFDPGATNVFGSAGIDNRVSANQTVQYLWLAQTNKYHNMQIDAGVTLTVAGTNYNGYGPRGNDSGNAAPTNAYSTMYVGTHDNVTAGATALKVTNTISGGGTLVLNNTNNELNVRQVSTGSSTHWSVLDLSGLNTFTATLGRIRVGDGEFPPMSRPSGFLYLAKTNNITLTGTNAGSDAQLVVGQSYGNPGAASFLYLGQKNNLSLDMMLIGGQKSTGSLLFNPAVASPTLLLRGRDGVSRVAAIRIGDISDQGASSSGGNGTVDLRSGTSDILADAIIVGKGQNANGAGAGVGSLALGAGTLDANSLVLASQTVVNQASAVTGTATFSNTTVVVNKLLQLGVSAGSAQARNATLRIYGGSFIVASNLVTQGTATINVTNAVLQLRARPSVLASIINLDGGAISNAATLKVTNQLNIVNSGQILGGSPVFDLGNSGTAVWNVAGTPTGGLVVSNVLQGSGTINGNLTQAAGATLNPGGSASAGTLTESGNLTLNAGTLKFDLSSSGGSGNDQLSASGTVTLNATNGVNLTALNGVLDTVNPYTLISSSGGLVGGNSTYFQTVGGLGSSRYSFTYDTSDGFNVKVSVSGAGPANLTWVGDGSANNWNLKTTFNWNNGSAAQFYSLDAVTFDDSGSASPAVNLVGTLNPGSLTVNNPTKNYTFSGTGGLIGTGLTKSGAGSLTFNNTGDNFFASSVTINNGGVTLNNTGLNTFDNGLTTTGGGFTLSGAGTNVFTAGTSIAIGVGSSLTVANANANTFNAVPIQLDGALTVNQAVNSTIDGAITGAGTLTKAGSGVLKLSGVNSGLSSVVQINAGTIQAGTTTALGSTGVVVTNSGTLDLNGISLGGLPLTVSGSGVGGNGALVSSAGVMPGGTLASPSPKGLNNVTMTGNTTFGGSGPWKFDIVANVGDWGIANGSLSTGGNAYNLTKVGLNEVSLNNSTVDAALGNIVVQQGLLDLAYGTSSLGNPTNTITIQSGATVSFWSTSTAWDKKFVLFGDGVTPSLLDYSGANTIIGPVTLNGSCVIDAASATWGSPVSITLNGSVGGTGSLTKAGQDTLILGATNSYTGNTTVNAGTLEVVVASIATNSTVSVAAGAVLQLDFAETNVVSGFKTNGVSLPVGVYNSGNVTNITGSGSLQVVASGPSGPATIAKSYSGGVLSLSWPAGQGWRLQAQTNALSVGLKTNWVYVTDGSVSSTNITVDATKPTVFYRLTYP